MQLRHLARRIGSVSFVPAAGLALLLSGCATLWNPGSVDQMVEPTSGDVVRTASFMIKGFNWDTYFFEGNDSVRVYDSHFKRDLTEERRDACRVWDRLTLDQQVEIEMAYRRSDGRLLGDVCLVIPTIRLSTDGPRTLRVVRKGQEKTVTVQAKWRWYWVWWNAFLGPGWPVGVGVDALTKRWTYYSTLDLSKVFPPSVAGGSLSQPSAVPR